MPPTLSPIAKEALEDYIEQQSAKGKGALAVMLVLTRNASELDFPLIADDFLTGGGGQVAGLGKAATQNILAEHGITRVLAQEGGRTSRGNMGRMRAYVDLLNDLHQKGAADLKDVEVFWVEKISEFFASKPLVLKLDQSKSLRLFVRDLLDQAQKRQKESPGVQYAGAVLQYLVGAKLELHDYDVEHHGFSVADGPTDRAGDYIINDVVIHVTTAPAPALMEKCQKNIDGGLKPIIVTTDEGMTLAKVHGKAGGVEDRIDVFEVEQFVATNIYELSDFAPDKRHLTVAGLVAKYNEIVEAHETDHSMKIRVR